MFYIYIFTIFIWLDYIHKCFSISERNWTLIAEQIRNKFKQHVKYVTVPLDARELLCFCNELGCDTEITEIAGDEYMGICRTFNGGVCRKLNHYDTQGKLVKSSSSCIHPHQLLPPERPFICQNVTSSKFIQHVKCCSDYSFCNIIENQEEMEKSSSMHWLLTLIFVTCILFSFAIFIGIWYFKTDKKSNSPNNIFTRIFRGTYGTITNGSKKATPPKDPPLEKLIDDHDVTVSTGAGMPILAQRTISRQIRIRECIGRGRFGEVFVGEWRGEQVAVKIFHSRDESSWSRETDIYQTNMLRHTNLLRWIATDNKDTGVSIQLWLITEYLPNGSLYDYLEKNVFSVALGLQFLRSIANGLSYLHTEVPGIGVRNCYKPGIAHRDIKSRNILIKNDFTCVIADLGMAVRCIKGVMDLPNSSRAGTIRYLAPEFLSDSFHRESFNSYLQMDIYAFALVMWEISRRIVIEEEGVQSSVYELPYCQQVQREPGVNEMYECVVVKGYRPSIPMSWKNSPVMSELARLISESWNMNPNSRLTSLNIRYSLDKLINEFNLKVVM